MKLKDMRHIILIIALLLSFQFVDAQRIQRNDKGYYGLVVNDANDYVKWIVPPKYLMIQDNNDGTYSVWDRSFLWGVLSTEGEIEIACKYKSVAAAREAYILKLSASNFKNGAPISKYPDFTLGRDYSSFIKKYVEEKINSWQKKGEFEKTADYQKRVTESARRDLVHKYTAEICETCLSRIGDKELRMSLGEYDADNETFLVNTEIGKIVIPVPIDKAPSFKKNWSQIISKNTYDIANGKIILRSAIFSLNGKEMARYNDQNHALYAQANVQYNFEPIEIPMQDMASVRTPNVVEKTIHVGKSDVDMNIPMAKSENTKTFAVIFANETYRNESVVRYAHNDGDAVRQYLVNTLGIPEKNAHFVTDATKNDMIREFDWLKNVANAFDKDINVIVYYAGHGVPGETDGSAFLIPVDGVGTNTKTLYPLAELYNELGSIDTNSTIVFLDACFSGAQRGNGMLASARGVALKAKQEKPKSNMIVFSAATGDETAWPYEEKGHGLFTYFLLKKIQESKGEVSLGQLADFVTDQVEKYSIVSNSKKQTPTVTASPEMATSWKTIKLK